MPGDKQHWETIYAQKKPNEVSWFQQDPTRSLELIRSVTASRQHRIIDVGGGASVLVDRLLEDGYSDLSVLDLSEKALEYAKERLGLKAAKVTWIVGDATVFRAEKPFDLCMTGRFSIS